MKGLIRVCLYQDDGWSTDIVPYYDKDPANPRVQYEVPPARYVYDRNNILVSDVRIRWCEAMNLTDNLFWLQIDTPRGTSLYEARNNMPANVNVQLQGRLFYGTEEITARETCKFMWFRQKYSATGDKVNHGTPGDPEDTGDKDEFGRTWYDYGGNGWAPIERLMLSGNPNDADYDPVFGEGPYTANGYSFEDETWHEILNVGIAAVPWKWMYKLVCVYNPTATTQDEKLARDRREVILSEIVFVLNESSIYDFELPNPMIMPNLRSTYLRVLNKTLPWIEGVNWNPQVPTVPDNSLTAEPEKDWWCRWWLETPAGLYEPVPHTGQPRFLKGMRSINDYLSYDVVTFKAQVYGVKGALDPAASAQVNPPEWDGSDGKPNQYIENNEHEIANLEIVIAKNDQFTLLIDWIGPENHSYNADGSIKWHAAAGEEYTLQAVLHWADSTIQDYSIEWIAPDGGTPLRHHSAYLAGELIGTGFVMNESMMYDMWVDANSIVHYKVNQKYDINKTLNTYTLRVTLLDGTVYEYQKEIIFTKAGQNGTQGSDWEARIWPTNNFSIFGADVSFPAWT